MLDMRFYTREPPGSAYCSRLLQHEGKRGCLPTPQSYNMLQHEIASHLFTAVLTLTNETLCACLMRPVNFSTSVLGACWLSQFNHCLLQSRHQLAVPTSKSPFQGNLVCRQHNSIAVRAYCNTCTLLSTESVSATNTVKVMEFVDRQVDRQ